MKGLRLFTLLLVLLSVVLLASIVSADEGSKGRNAYFVGLWEGVDPNDGSRRTVSISDNDRDGVYELIQYDTFWTLCGDDRAVATGTATVGRMVCLTGLGRSPASHLVQQSRFQWIMRQ